MSVVNVTQLAQTQQTTQDTTQHSTSQISTAITAHSLDCSDHHNMEQTQEAAATQRHQRSEHAHTQARRCDILCCFNMRHRLHRRRPSLSNGWTTHGRLTQRTPYHVET